MPTSPDSRRRRVIVINDDPAVMAMYRDALEELNHEPITMAIDTVEIEDIREARADAVILDMQVGAQPDYGLKLAQQLRVDDQFAAIPIIVCTANANALVGARRHLQAIDVPILLKPVDLDELQALLGSPLEHGTRSVDTPTLVLDGGPRHGDTDTQDRLSAVVGDGNEGGIYQRTDEERDGRVVYRWQALDEAEVKAIVRGDVRANQRPGP